MIVKKNNTRFVVIGLLLAVLMAAMDNTIVATAMGSIVADLGGFDKFVWVTSAYMVAVMAGTPIFGKLSDMYGRKRFFVFGLLVFAIGSFLCGSAESMIQLSIYRAIQGIGGGALMPISFTIIFDLFPPEKRGKMTGLIGAVFGISSIFGPLLGSYITEYINWHWVFYINLPIGVVSLCLIAFFYKESMEHKEQKIDWWGAATLVAAIVCLMFALELGGNQYAWDSGVIISLFAGFAVFFAAFLYIETKAQDPIVSFEMFKKRLFTTSNAVTFFYGATFIIATVYIPIFVQGVFGGTATNSGLILTPMMLGSVFGSQIGGILASKTSYRNIMIFSAVFFVAGVFLLSTLSPDTARSMVTIYMVIMGFGVGFSFSTLSMAAIHNFDMKQRGAATSSNSFFRSLGMTLGITIFGIIQRNLFSDKLKDAFSGMKQTGAHGNFGDSSALLSPEAREKIPAAVLNKITEALSSSIAQTFMWALIPALLAVVFILLMSPERIQKKAAKKQKTEMK
ncbi:EmrB/QacA subfamily drug resistance transporter [Scopulibacillus daqui]|uniref:EmrB/QacA subfamily drug resistance transporter n=1 Tax=Scopulibacillus daqui TaxID=1469162 RepID=A0ABS2Q0U8_9BACL|nr:MDR family MFS transporter [Scopulibacillus daqui]MBM7645917.1 EmrB/QacA subfamily drug resistance transporter [Scopulibacillus daqui]